MKSMFSNRTQAFVSTSTTDYMLPDDDDNGERERKHSLTLSTHIFLFELIRRQ